MRSSVAFYFGLEAMQACSLWSTGWASWDQAGGVLSYAAVPRVGLGPTTPPLCRYAEYTTDLI